MTLAQRLATAVTVVVSATTLVVLGASLGWARLGGTVPPGALLAGIGGALVALLLSHAYVRTSTLPVIRRMFALARDLRRIAGSRELNERLPVLEDAEIAAVAQGVNAVLDRVDELKTEATESRGIVDAMLAGAPHGMVVVDADGQISRVNAKLTAMFSLRADPVGRPPIEVIPVAELQEMVEHIRSGGTPGAVACGTASRDLLLVPTKTAQGGMVVQIIDETAEREVERFRADFIANVSHELRTPVTAIMGYTETLLHDVDQLPEPTAMMLHTVDRNARRLRDLFEDLLKLHRIQARRRELPVRDQALLPLLAESVVSVVDTASNKGLDFELDCDDQVSARVNEESLSAIVGNLASNACKYTPEGGKIIVRARRVGAEVAIDVEDNGIGIDPKHHDRVFERFYRVDEGRAREVGGTGLGLALVKHLALASGYRVTLKSAQGQGSVFSVWVPAGAA